MTDRHWHPALSAAPHGFERARARRSSHYLTMRDGARIAIDVHVPDPLAGRAPAVLRQTRYLRSLEPRAPGVGDLVVEAFDLYARTRRVFLDAGYAWVDVDVRGSGVSSGATPYPWSMDEIRDGAEVVDWIVAQPWSSGAVGSLGISYDGTAAEMLLVNRHPAVKAVAPLFALYDVYTDVAFPGGLHLAWFTEAWARYNAALDRGAFAEASTAVLRLIARAAAVSPAPRGFERALARIGALDEASFARAAGALVASLVAGVRPVDGDRVAALRAVADHAANVSVHEGALRITYRDDRGISTAAPEGTVDTLSPRTFAADAAASGAAVYGYSGWRDAAYQNAAIKRHHALAGRGGHRLTIGPWVHAGKLRIRPFDVATPPSFDHDAELLAFFDEHVRGRAPAGDGLPVHYYTFVEERWKAASSWPPPAEPEVLHLAEGFALSPIAPDAAGGHDAHRVDPTAGTGERTRWRSLLSLVPGDYPDRRERDARLLVYDSPPLGGPLEVTGHPVVRLFVSWDDDADGRVFAYLEDVAPDGRVAYVTEGQLRALHRRLARDRAPLDVPSRTFRREDAHPLPAGEIGELVFDLLPISWRFDRGHRVRLALAGGDADHFVASRPSTLRVHRSQRYPSSLELPMVR
jgi:putative CocE/NonD family hydrolase